MHKKDADMNCELGICEVLARSVLYYIFKSIMKNRTLDLERQKLKKKWRTTDEIKMCLIL